MFKKKKKKKKGKKKKKINSNNNNGKKEKGRRTTPPLTWRIGLFSVFFSLRSGFCHTVYDVRQRFNGNSKSINQPFMLSYSALIINPNLYIYMIV